MGGGGSQDSRENKNTISPLNLMMIFAFHAKKPVFSKFWLKKSGAGDLVLTPEGGAKQDVYTMVH